MTQKYRPIRATLNDQLLIDLYEEELFQESMTERELIEKCLREHFSEKEEYEVYFDHEGDKFKNIDNRGVDA